MNTSDSEHERGRFAGLLVAQLLFIFLTPFIDQEGAGWWFIYVGVFAILAAGIYAASQNPGELKIALVILLPVLFAWVGPDLLTPTLDECLRLLTPAISYAFTAFVVIRDVYRHEKVTSDTILGAINVYMLIALAFMLFHASVMTIEPNAYMIAGQSLREFLDTTEHAQSFPTILYFSYTTLTTLGYGDIVPVRPFSQLLTSAESAFGQLFVAIIIGRLVGLEVSARSGRAASSA